jgi:hypothetical protein
MLMMSAARTTQFALSLSKGSPHTSREGFLRHAQDHRKNKLSPNGIRYGIW